WERRARLHAPIVYLHSEEVFFPGDPKYAFSEAVFKNDHMEFPLSGNQSGDAKNNPFYLGVMPSGSQEDQISVYTTVVPKSDDSVHVIYWLAYPYNEGKYISLPSNGTLQEAAAVLCIPYLVFLNPIGYLACYIAENKKLKKQMPSQGNGEYGNHVYDWERVVIRWKDDQPETIHLPAHGAKISTTAPWGNDAIEYEDNRPIVYAAKGSHGVYPSPGKVVWETIKIGAVGIDLYKRELIDEMDRGYLWDTQNNLNVFIPESIIKESAENAQASPQEITFNWGDEPLLYYMGRWGNNKDACFKVDASFLFFKKFSTGEQCKLSNAPTGPAVKHSLRFDHTSFEHVSGYEPSEDDRHTSFTFDFPLTTYLDSHVHIDYNQQVVLR
ncbi:MAG: Vps62-related protein, partial [Gammaproteobacteria bacterium]|nr:Vps62-related protein [Gammaproteobacteria bacterium]